MRHEEDGFLGLVLEVAEATSFNDFGSLADKDVDAINMATEATVDIAASLGFGSELLDQARRDLHPGLVNIDTNLLKTTCLFKVNKKALAITTEPSPSPLHLWKS